MSQDASGLKGESKNLLKKVLLTASGTLTSRILGLFRDMAMAAFFDRMVTDAWAVAFRLPNFFRRILGEGTFSLTFIPILQELEANSNSADSARVRQQNLINSFFTLGMIVLSLLTVLGTLYTEQWLAWLTAPEFQAHTEGWNLTVRMARIMFGFTFCVSTYSYLMTLMHALGRFALPALAPALLNVSMLFFTVLPPSWFPQVGDGLAWGVLVGGAAQALLLVGALYRLGSLPRFQRLQWGGQGQKILRSVLLVALGGGFFHWGTLISLYYASTLSEGAISHIYWADRLLEFPLTMISVSLGTVMLPTLSALVRRPQEFAQVLRENILLNFMFAWPASLGLFFLASPIVEVLFLRGHFQQSDAQQTAQVLQVYALAIVILSVGRILVPVYSALQRNVFLAVAAVGGLSVHLLLGQVWVQEQGLAGLILAMVCGAVVHTAFLIGGLRRYSLAWGSKTFWRSLGQMLLAGGGVALYLYLRRSEAGAEGTQLAQGAELVFDILVALALYFGALKALRNRECDLFIQGLRAQRTRKQK